MLTRVSKDELLAAVRAAANSKEPGEESMAHAARLAVQAGVRMWRFEQMAGEEIMRQALKRTGGNKSKAAELIGIHRNTLDRRLRLSEMDGRKPVESEHHGQGRAAKAATSQAV